MKRLGSWAETTSSLTRITFASLVCLAACGGDAAAPATSSSPVPIHTLAYVVSECRETAGGFFERDALVTRDGERDPVTVAEIPELGPATLGPGELIGTYCRFYSELSLERGGFTRLGVSPDGSTVVFEETDEFSTVFRDFLAPEQKGIYAVRADGTGLRRLGPPSRESTFNHFAGFYFFNIAFSPDGRTIAVPDRGPSSAGDDAAQIVTIDLSTGVRTQITHLPPILPNDVQNLPAVFGPIFLDNETIAFFTSSTLLSVAFTVKVDGSDLKIATPPVALPGAQIVPQFAITGDRLRAFPAILPSAPSGPPLFIGTFPHSELFVLDGPNLLQLTSFGRGDTATNGALVSPDARHLFFTASADPLGTNPSANCQLFSIDRIGTDLRQLTDFRTRTDSRIGCIIANNFPGCALALQAQDATTGTLVFAGVGCDPFATNPGAGGQIFAIRPDGSGLRQLTNGQGRFTAADGAFHAEVPYPLAYGPYRPGGTNLP